MLILFTGLFERDMSEKPLSPFCGGVSELHNNKSIERHYLHAYKESNRYHHSLYQDMGVVTALV